jgi:hypothetical protein
VGEKQVKSGDFFVIIFGRNKPKRNDCAGNYYEK